MYLRSTRIRVLNRVRKYGVVIADGEDEGDAKPASATTQPPSDQYPPLYANYYVEIKALGEVIQMCMQLPMFNVIACLSLHLQAWQYHMLMDLILV